MKVIKRNGSEVDFDVEKIIVAITKANNANVSLILAPPYLYLPTLYHSGALPCSIADLISATVIVLSKPPSE